MNTKAIIAHFNFGDWHLGNRRLLDEVIATQDFSLYETALLYCDEYDKLLSKPEEKDWQKVVLPLIEKIEKISGNIPIIEPYTTIDINNVSKQYNKGKFSLKPISFKLTTGQITGLVGENGNGKTTLLRTIFGELEPDNGEIKYYLLNNNSPSKFNYKVKTKLSFIPQRPNAWHGSLNDNLQFAATHAGYFGKNNYLWTQLIFARMGLRPFRNFSWKQISSGYKMRFELAKALISRPTILLLDEPLANLDILAQQIILDDLKFLTESTSMPLSIILSSQQLYEVEKVSSQIIFLKNGEANITNNDKLNENEAIQLIIELETTATREEINEIFPDESIEKLSYNGGVYLLYFNENITINIVLKTLANANIEINYFRNITKSARRFFDA